MHSKTPKLATCCLNPQKRHIFTLLGFLAMIVLYSLRVNLSVAIVSMVRHDHDHGHKKQLTQGTPDLPLNASEGSGNWRGGNTGASGGEFEWDERVQGLVLGAFFWGYVVLQLPGGQMADRLGGKWLLGGSILGTALLTLFSPLAARLHYGAFIACRALEGLFEVRFYSFLTLFFILGIFYLFVSLGNNHAFFHIFYFQKNWLHCFHKGKNQLNGRGEGIRGLSN